MTTIAFIPVRGGSKSIPLKNIKLLCGKPLVCWNIEALEACTQVDQIVVATDSDEIERTVSGRHYTLDRAWKGTDHTASLEPDGVSKLARTLTYKEEGLIDKIRCNATN